MKQIVKEPPRGNINTLTYSKFLEYKNKVNIDTDFGKLLNNKRVVIVGPSPNTIGRNLGQFIDNFDLVVRVNKSFPVVQKYIDDIGSRTDILYHCLLQNEANCGKVYINEMLKENVKYICCPYPKFMNPFHRDVITFEYQNQNRLKFRTIDLSYYISLVTDVKTRLNSGIGAIMDLVVHNIKELHIIGYTFYEDGFYKGYRNHPAMKDTGKDSNQWSGNQISSNFNGNHQQLPQKQVIKMLGDYDSRVTLDEQTKIILDRLIQ